MVSDNLKTAVGWVCGGPQVNKTRKIQDRDKTGIRQRQDPRLQGRAPGFRGEGYQVRDKTGIRQGQDRDKSGARQRKERDKIREGEG